MTKLTSTTIYNILYLKSQGLTHEKIADKLGIPWMQVQGAVQYTRWGKWKPPEHFITGEFYHEMRKNTLGKVRMVYKFSKNQQALKNLIAIEQQLIQILEPNHD